MVKKFLFHLMRERQLREGNYEEKSTDRRRQERNKLKWNADDDAGKKILLKKGFVHIGKNQLRKWNLRLAFDFFF